MSDADSATELERIIERYNDAWNAQDLDAIVSFHAPGMVFENHTAGERAEGTEVREHIGGDLRQLARPLVPGPPAVRPRRPRRQRVDGDGDRRGRARGSSGTASTCSRSRTG